MKKFFLITSFCFLSILAACNNDSAVEGLYEESGNTINVNNQRSDIYNRNAKNTSEDFGYVRHKKSPIMGEQTANDNYASIDRENLAGVISKLSTELPEVDDVSTLVTSEEVLVVYDTESKDRNLTADQVKRTAMSVVPRWYHVYVTDNTALRGNVESFSTMDSDSQKVEYAIDQLIKEMKKSPQGKKMSNDENANGESPEDMK